MYRSSITAFAVGCLACACASAQHYSVAVIGDLPYVQNQAERDTYLPRYHRLLARLDSADVAVVVHLGDYTTGPFCGDSVVNERYGEFARSAHPFVFLFGDNDWTDCRRGGFDPDERLRKLRDVFTHGNTTLGRSTMPIARQSDHPEFAKFRENVRWTMGNELYVGLNVTGSYNNWGRGEQPSAEYVERNAANLAWLREGFGIARRENRRGVVVMIQANPGLEDLPYKRKAEDAKGFTDFNNELMRLAADFARPVLLIHGDTHYFRIDKPFNDVKTGHVIPNLTRVEGFAHPNYHWVRISVDAADPRVFRIVPEIVEEHRR